MNDIKSSLQMQIEFTFQNEQSLSKKKNCWFEYKI